MLGDFGREKGRGRPMAGPLARRMVPLGLVHVRVGRVDEGGRLIGSRGDGPADAGKDAQLRVDDVEGGLERRRDTADDGRCVGGLCDVVAHYDELVTSLSAQGVGRQDRRAKPFGPCTRSSSPAT